MSGPPPFPADFYFKERDVLCQQGWVVRNQFSASSLTLEHRARRSFSEMPADKTDLPSRLFFFSPIRKKFILGAAGAWTDSKDLALRDACAVQNGCV